MFVIQIEIDQTLARVCRVAGMPRIGVVIFVLIEWKVRAALKFIWREMIDRLLVRTGVGPVEDKLVAIGDRGRHSRSGLRRGISDQRSAVIVGGKIQRGVESIKFESC